MGRGFQVAEAFVQIIDTITIIDLPVWLHLSMAVLGGMCINTKTVSPFNFKTSLPRVEGYSADFSSETLPHAKPSSAAFCSPTLDKTPKIPPGSLSQSSQNEVLGHGFWVIIHVFVFVFAAFCTEVQGDTQTGH